MNEQVITITGAAGQIGYALLLLIAQGELFGPSAKVHLNLVDIEGSTDYSPLQRLKGTVQELEDVRRCLSALGRITVTTDLQSVLPQSDWVILVGGAPRQKGMLRQELLQRNAAIFIEQGSLIHQFAKESAKILVVANPCHTNCLLAAKQGKRLSWKNFFSLSQLDVERAISRVAAQANAALHEVEQLFVWGNHSNTMVVDYLNTTISGKQLLSQLQENWLQEHLQTSVRAAGESVIAQRGASSALSAAMAICETIKNLSGSNVHPYSVGRMTDEAAEKLYGVPPGLICSLPTINRNNTPCNIEGLQFNTWLRDAIARSVDELQKEFMLVDGATL